ncbi:MAG TPA: CYCXC family (seleno)protein [Pyrinomonadaceae bacterium]|nr:CYCXC family (seleno)protein [Pyrinomonadaceae bacterium]
MTKTWVLIGGVIVLLIAAVLVVNQQRAREQAGVVDVHHNDSHTSAHRSETPATTQPKVAIPAYFETAPNRASLGPTLAPEKFTGLTRDAYRVAREIPVTLAQMPCYCYCDRGMGHKSLYSCFEDDHAAHCAVCVNEALLAHKLEKDGLTAPQIRDRINETFGSMGN